MDSIRFKLTISILGLSLAACSALRPTATETPTLHPTLKLEITLVPSATLTPTSPATPVPTLTPVPTTTPTPTPPFLVETPLPGEYYPISSWNADQVSELAEWNEETVTALAWTPDSQTLAVANYGFISLVDIQTHSQEGIVETENGLISIAFHPSGSLLASGNNPGSQPESYKGSVDFWQVSDWSSVKPHFEDERGVSEVTFSPDGLWFAAAFTGQEFENNSSVDFWDTASWEITSTLKTGTALDIAFSPDGQRLASTPNRYAIKMWRVDKGILLYTTYTSFTGAVNAIVFSPDGQNLATGHYDGEIRIWNAATGELMRIIETGSVIESLAYSPDGTVLASGDSYEGYAVRLWDIASGQLLRTLEGHTHAVGSLEFSPNGQILASGSYDGNVRLWAVGP